MELRELNVGDTLIDDGKTCVVVEKSIDDEGNIIFVRIIEVKNEM